MKSTSAAIRKNAKHFRVVAKRQYYRLTHVPSGDYIQRHLCDFLTRRQALECRNAVINAAPQWDWSNPTLFQEMGNPEWPRVWHAIYGNTQEVAS